MASGRILINEERCKGCELCFTACPPGVIGLADYLNSHGYRPASLIDPKHECTGCALCAVVCPDAAITVFRDVPAANEHSRSVEARSKLVPLSTAEVMEVA